MQSECWVLNPGGWSSFSIYEPPHRLRINPLNLIPVNSSPVNSCWNRRFNYWSSANHTRINAHRISHSSLNVGGRESDPLFIMIWAIRERIMQIHYAYTLHPIHVYMYIHIHIHLCIIRHIMLRKGVGKNNTTEIIINTLHLYIVMYNIQFTHHLWHVVVVVDPHLHACLEVSFHTLKWRGIQYRFPHSCPECFIWNCSYIVYPSKMKGPFRDNWQMYFYLWMAFQVAGGVEGICRALVLDLVLIAETAIEQAPSVGPNSLICDIINDNLLINSKWT